jgi:hypothetical protein
MKTALKRLLGSAVLTRLATRRTPHVVSLSYHDLREDDDFANWLRIGVSEFEAHLDELSRLGRFIAPEDLEHPEALAPGLHFLPTFDDGYVTTCGWRCRSSRAAACRP